MQPSATDDQVSDSFASDENEISEILNSLNKEHSEDALSEEEFAPTAPESGIEASTNELLSELAKDDSSYLEQGEVKVKKPMKKSVIAVIVCAVIVVAAVVAGLLIWTNPPKGGKSGNTLGNLANYGYAVTDGEWTYFTALGTQSAGEDTASTSSGSSESAKISIFKTNGKEEKTLVESGGTSLNVSGNYVYYIGYSDGYVYRVKKDGSNVSQLNSVKCSALQVKGSYIYYVSSSDGAVYTMRKDGGKTTKISPDDLVVYQIAVDDDGIYYISQSDTHLYKANLDFSNAVAISEQTQATRFTMDKDYIYYTVVNEDYVSSDSSSDSTSSKASKSTSSTSSEAVSSESSDSDSDAEIITYKAKKDGSNPQKLVENALCPIVVGDYVYYSEYVSGNQDGKNSYYICRIKTDGTGFEKFEHKGQLFNYSDNLLYYINADTTSEDYGYVYKINIDGTDPRKL